MKKRNQKIKYPTNDICKRGFARHLQRLLLDDFSNEPKPLKVINSLLDLLEKNNIIYADNALFTEVLFKKWWNGIAFPGNKNQETINLAFNGLSDLWFSRDNYQHRFQLYLASQDLSYVNNRDNKQGKFESNHILNFIIKNWAPRNIGNGKFDLCILGSKSRGGFQFQENDIRQHESYDLSIIESSYVGLDIPDYISNIYQAEHKLSIIPYMFCLLCLNLGDNKNGYKLDLFFDLLSALNCAKVLLPDLDLAFLSGQDRIEKQILTIRDSITQIFFTEKNLPSKIIDQPKYKIENSPDYLFLIDHRITYIPNVLENILNDSLSEADKSDLIQRSGGIESGLLSFDLPNIFNTSLYNLTINNDVYKDIIYSNLNSQLSEISINSIKIISDFLNFYYYYINLFTGLTPKEIIKSLNTKINTDSKKDLKESGMVLFSTERYPL